VLVRQEQEKLFGKLVFHGEKLAVIWGIDPAVVALILIAFGTSIPELATSVVAARKGQGDIIIGNAIGSCIFNILAVMGITSLVKSVAFEGVEVFNLWVMLGVTVAIVGRDFTYWISCVLRRSFRYAEGIAHILTNEAPR